MTTHSFNGTLRPRLGSSSVAVQTVLHLEAATEPEALRRMQELVCELLLKNQQLRMELARREKNEAALQGKGEDNVQAVER